MKIIKVESCNTCVLRMFSLCELLNQNRIISLPKDNTIHPDCPLDDDNKANDIDIVNAVIESIRDYERESHNLIGFDERETNELVKIFMSHWRYQLISDNKNI